MNGTNSCLIPKNDKPTDMAKFLPISLCNIRNKIVVFNGKDKKNSISYFRNPVSRFCSKTNNINRYDFTRSVHALKKFPEGRNKKMAIKKYIRKAYDIMEWNFIRVIMHKMGFVPTWIDWIMRCISWLSTRSS